MGNFHGVAGASRRPLIFSACAASAGLSLLFLAVYSGTNWLTAQRSDVGTWYYAWERFIPFVPLMVIPYMSIDLFFAAAPFLCRDRRELATFSRRVTLAILAGGACFLLMPLKLGHERPRVDGWIGACSAGSSPRICPTTSVPRCTLPCGRFWPRLTPATPAVFGTSRRTSGSAW